MPFRWAMIRPFHVCLILLLLDCSSIIHSMVLEPLSLSEQYKEARQVRCLQGHEAASSFYQSILKCNPSDGTTATRLAASPHAVRRLEKIGHNDDSGSIETIRNILKKANYTSASVGALLFSEEEEKNERMRSCPCPVYVSPAAAGSASFLPTEQRTTPLQVLVSLFLLGLAVPIAALPDPRLLDSGLVFPCDFDSSLAIAYVSIFPFDIDSNKETLFFMTDWHPRVFSTTRINHDEEPVMYIGPDSLALAQHFILGFNNNIHNKNSSSWLDVCTGSGIQAIVASKMGLCQHVVCVDVNPRALRFAQFNAALNHITQNSISFVRGDLLEPPANNRTPLASLLTERGRRRYRVVTANPPFLPVPMETNHRHGLFSSGGPSGEAVLQAVLGLAQDVLEENGMLAVVSEFFFRHNSWQDDDSLLFGTGIMLTNQFSLSAFEYAKRRADSEQEFHVWLSHLKEQEIHAMSPGLLYVQKTSTSSASSWKQVQVPKSSEGSIWTPGNRRAVQFTRTASNEYFRHEVFQTSID